MAAARHLVATNELFKKVRINEVFDADMPPNLMADAPLPPANDPELDNEESDEDDDINNQNAFGYRDSEDMLFAPSDGPDNLIDLHYLGDHVNHVDVNDYIDDIEEDVYFPDDGEVDDNDDMLDDVAIESHNSIYDDGISQSAGGLPTSQVVQAPSPAIRASPTTRSPPAKRGKLHRVEVAPAEGQIPKALFLDHQAELLTFPLHFPDGINGMNQKRCVNEFRHKLTNAAYAKNRLINEDPRFCRDHTYVFWLHYCLLYKQVRLIVIQTLTTCSCALFQMVSSISVNLNKTYTHYNREPLTVEGAQRKDVLTDYIVSADGNTFMSSIRGSPAYWRKVRPCHLDVSTIPHSSPHSLHLQVALDVTAMVKQLGEAVLRSC